LSTSSISEGRKFLELKLGFGTLLRNLLLLSSPAPELDVSDGRLRGFLVLGILKLVEGWACPVLVGWLLVGVLLVLPPPLGPG